MGKKSKAVLALVICGLVIVAVFLWIDSGGWGKITSVREIHQNPTSSIGKEVQLKGYLYEIDVIPEGFNESQYWGFYNSDNIYEDQIIEKYIDAYYNGPYVITEDEIVYIDGVVREHAIGGLYIEITSISPA